MTLPRQITKAELVAELKQRAANAQTLGHQDRATAYAQAAVLAERLIEEAPPCQTETRS